MPLTRTLAELRTEARQYADMESSAYISDAEANRYVNLGLSQLWHLLVSVDIDRYATSTEVATSGGTYEYALPNDFAQLRAVERLDRSGAETGYALFRYNIGEGHARNSFPEFSDTTTGLRYTVYGQGVDGTATRLRFDGDPGARYFRVWYVQHPVTLVNDADTFDGVADRLSEIGFSTFVGNSGRAVAEDFAVDLCPSSLSRTQFFEDQNPRAFAKYRASSIRVVRST